MVQVRVMCMGTVFAWISTLNGRLSLMPHPSMQRVMRTYIDSGFATRVLDDAKAVGFLENLSR